MTRIIHRITAALLLLATGLLMGSGCPPQTCETLGNCPTGACLLSGSTCELQIEFQCTSQGGTWQGADTSCPTLPPADESPIAFGVIPLPQDQYNSIPLAALPATGQLPLEMDLSAYMPPIGNQGYQGSCVAWATAYALKTYQEKRERGWDVSIPAHQFSPAFAYNQTKIGNCLEGTFIISALNLLIEKGCATLATMPYDPSDCSATPSPQAFQEARSYRIKDWRRVNVQDIHELKVHLASGSPIVVAIRVYDNMMPAYWSHKLPSDVYSQVSGPFKGYHAICLDGYNDDLQALKAINSWGTDWGAAGYLLISYQTFQSLVFEGFVAEDLTDQDNPPAPPSTPFPVNGAVSVDLNTSLDWADAARATSYDVYFGTTNPPPLWSTTINSNATPAALLSYNTTYYWQVLTKNASGSAAGPVWSFTTVPQPVTPPDAPSSPSPSNGQTGVSIDADLDWADAARADFYDVYFGTSNPPSTFIASPLTSAWSLGTLNYSTTYYWKVVARNSAGGTTGPVWSFTTGAAPVTPPDAPSSPSPSNGQTGVSIDADLDWADAARADFYDVYFGTSNPPNTLIASPLTSAWSLGTLNYSTTYYWKVVARNSAGGTTGPVWSFTTVPQPVTPPDAPSSPSPSNGQTGVSIDADLDWADAARATSYDVYFGTTSPPPYVTNSASSSYLLGTLQYNTWYYWKVIAKNSAGVTAGSIWTFRTGLACAGTPCCPFPSNGATNVGLNITLNWPDTTNTTTYDLYLGETNPPPPYAGGPNTPISQYTLGVLPGKTYYWKVLARNDPDCTPVSGPVWSFTTHN